MRVAHLMYHELEQTGRALCSSAPGYVRYVVGEESFQSQLARMASLGLHGVAVGTALDATAAGSIVVVTFDDGCASDLEIAAPLLSAHGFSSTHYVTSGSLDTRGFLSRSQLQELAELGFEIGSHSVTHRYLTDLTTNEIEREISDSKAELESLIGRPVEHFSCPGGRWDARVARIVREAGYRTMATSDVGTNQPDWFKLSRLAVMRGTSLETFDDLCRGRGLTGPRIRTRALRVAKAVLGNRLYDSLRARIVDRGTNPVVL